MAQYIQIDSIDDIDISTISIRDINKRYIDRNGFRYATRFNMTTRKIEVVRIVKGRQEADMVRRQINRERVQKTRPTHPQMPIASDGPELDDFVPHPSDEMPVDMSRENFSEVSYGGESFYENRFMEEASSDFDKIKERLQGIQNFIRNSTYYENHDSEKYSEIARDIDIEGLQKADAAVSHYKELTSYPRPVSYYLSRLPAQLKATIDAMADDEKLEVVRRHEVRGIFEETYLSIIRVATKLQGLMQGVPDSALTVLGAQQQQHFRDGLMAVNFLLENCHNKLSKIKLWKHKYP